MSFIDDWYQEWDDDIDLYSSSSCTCDLQHITTSSSEFIDSYIFRSSSDVMMSVTIEDTFTDNNDNDTTVIASLPSQDYIDPIFTNETISDASASQTIGITAPYLSWITPPIVHDYCYAYIYEFMISDSSCCLYKQQDRKKGGCKRISIVTECGGTQHELKCKVDARKSFSNRSFQRYYQRAPYAVITCANSMLVLIIEEKEPMHDDVHYVGMNSAKVNLKHPLIVLSSDTSYLCTYLSNYPRTNTTINCHIACEFINLTSTMSFIGMKQLKADG